MKNTMNLDAFGVEELNNVENSKIIGGSSQPVYSFSDKLYKVVDVTGGCAMLLLTDGTNYYSIIGTPMYCVNGQWTGPGFHGCK